jgi:hypothetical protein
VDSVGAAIRVACAVPAALVARSVARKSGVGVQMTRRGVAVDDVN